MQHRFFFFASFYLFLLLLLLCKRNRATGRHRKGLVLRKPITAVYLYTRGEMINERREIARSVIIEWYFYVFVCALLEIRAASDRRSRAFYRSRTNIFHAVGYDNILSLYLSLKFKWKLKRERAKKYTKYNNIVDRR